MCTYITNVILEQRRWCSGIMQDSHSCDPGSIPGRRKLKFYYREKTFSSTKPVVILMCIEI